MAFFKTFEFEFETRRLMWYTPYGGSDFAEVVKTTEKIKDGDYESWYQNWYALGQQLLKKTYRSDLSKGALYLRASRYFQAAEFFLHSSDERKLDAYHQSVDYFYQGLSLLKIPYQINQVDYQGFPLRTVLFQTNQDCKGTLYVCGGFDALLEELYFTNAKAALEQGYHVVLFEGPGQSHMLRSYDLPFTKQWHQVVEAVLKDYQDKVPGPKIGVGLSLGGLLMQRAQALNKDLFDKLVLYNYFPNLLDSFKTNIPKFLHRYVDTAFPKPLEALVSFYISKQKFLNWQIEHAKWTFGADNLNQLLKVCRDYEELVLETPVLVCLAKNDNYYDYKKGLAYFETIQSPHKKLVLFDKESYASDLHCQNGAAYDTNDEIFEWLD